MADVLGGHLHDGGVSVVLKANDQVICESKAKYGGENKVSGDWETISSMGSCAYTTPIPIKKGDVLTIETSFDFELHPASVFVYYLNDSKVY
jgi:Stress up-regulated Nod 19